MSYSPQITIIRDQNHLLRINVPASMHNDFKEMIHRATNLWPDAPAEIKHFADMITNGKPMQDYFSNPHLAGKVHANQSDKT